MVSSYPPSIYHSLDNVRNPLYPEQGVPRSEVRHQHSPPKILNAEEQQKLRTVCKVSFLTDLVNHRPLNTLYNNASQMAREVLDITASHIKPGITTDELDEIVHNETIKRNAYPSPLNYRCFPKSVCTYDALSLPRCRCIADVCVVPSMRSSVTGYPIGGL